GRLERVGRHAGRRRSGLGKGFPEGRRLGQRVPEKRHGGFSHVYEHFLLSSSRWSICPTRPRSGSGRKPWSARPRSCPSRPSAASPFRPPCPHPSSRRGGSLPRS